MCVVSMVIDHYNDRWRNYVTVSPDELRISKLERDYEELKREVENMRNLLVRAKEYDERTNQPDCRKESVDLVKRVAEAVGIDLKDLID